MNMVVFGHRDYVFIGGKYYSPPNLGHNREKLRKTMTFVSQFDLLVVESRNATTVILMLGSPEEEVLTRACDAIYRFVDKSA